ncbi:MAG TPA: VIT1/CCC1 transporter family protein [Stellaceae bacterium]|jgi:VIT1/CCC1 family predicted Fe2+/Mn2+ transporter|nr:VIT1/CCC1 transporter family protein [Stellaceae bacterium]
MPEKSSLGRYRSNLQGEVDSAALYRAMAAAEKDPRLSGIYDRLAAVEEAHAEFWRKQLARIGGSALARRPGWRTRSLVFLARRFGPQFVLPTLSTLEQRDSRQYDQQPEAIAGGLPVAERSHNRLIEAIASGFPGGASGTALARIEGRHRSGGNALRAAVLGANDGLVSNLSLVMGVAGAAVPGRTILLTGLAGLVAGACSMAMGEWLSVTSSRELNQQQIDVEADELKRMPEEEKEEMVLIYQAKGLDEAAARVLADRLMANADTALDTLVREELGIDPEELGGSPWAAGGASFGLFSAGAIFPVAPFFWLDGTPALLASLAAGGVALILIGAGTSLFTGRSLVFSAARQIGIGFAAAGVTFAIGRFVGVSLGG